MKSIAGKIALALIVPVFLLGMLEVGFRVLDVGFPVSFLVESEVNGEPVWVENPFFTYQIFSPPLARTPAPMVVRKQKPPGTFRVVVLGESAAQGDPIPDFGPPRVLEYVLRHHDPTARIEVINAAITAINSHIILGISRELKKLEPDVVIVYIGNNEVIGPYGPGTVFSKFVNSDAAIRLGLWANRFRITQVLRLTLAMLSDLRNAMDFGGVAMFMDHPVTADDPRLMAVRRRFENNIRDIVREAQAAGAEVLISTVAVNITDCPPSISMNRISLTESERRRWQASFDQGWTMAKIKAWPEALRHFSAALAMDDAHAGLQYWMGICRQETASREEAAASFTRAMDLDAFRYRTDSAMNDILRRLAATIVPPVHFVDAAAIFREQTEWRDADLFVDHVHFSMEGVSLLARSWASAILAMKSWSTLEDRHGAPGAAWLRSELMFTHVAEISVLQEMVRRFSKPPFSLQPDIGTRMENYSRRMEALTGLLRETAGDDILEQFRQRMSAYPDDLYFPMNFAQYLVSRHRYTEAHAVAATSFSRYPHRRGPRAILAYVYALQGQPEKAAEILYGYQAKHGYFAVTSASYLAGLLMAGGYVDEAVAVVQAILPRVRIVDYRWRIRDDLKRIESVRDRLNEARRDLTANRLNAAELNWRRLIQDQPGLGEAEFLLAVTLQKRGEQAEAFQMVQQALGSMNFARAYYFGGIWQLQYGSVTQGVELIERSLSLAQDDWQLVKSLAWILSAGPWKELRNPERAAELLDGLAKRMGSSPPMLQEARVLATEALEQSSGPPQIRVSP